MYPRGELEQLAARKVVLQARIAVRRWETAEAAVELARPLAFVDRGISVWRHISPWVKVLAVPGGLLLTKFFKSRRRAHGGHGGKLSIFLSALPAVVQGMKLFSQLRAAYAVRHSKPEAAPAPGKVPRSEENPPPVAARAAADAAAARPAA